MSQKHFNSSRFVADGHIGAAQLHHAMTNTKRDTLMIAAHIGADPRTVDKAVRGGSVLAPVRFAVLAAARELGITLPAAPLTSAETSRAA